MQKGIRFGLLLSVLALVGCGSEVPKPPEEYDKAKVTQEDKNIESEEGRR